MSKAMAEFIELAASRFELDPLADELKIALKIERLCGQSIVARNNTLTERRNPDNHDP